MTNEKILNHWHKEISRVLENYCDYEVFIEYKLAYQECSKDIPIIESMNAITVGLPSGRLLFFLKNNSVSFDTTLSLEQIISVQEN